MKEFTLKSSFDNLDIAVAMVEPKDTPKGILQIVHGMVEHKYRYYEFMEWMASQGYVCIAHDHRGHGGSIKDRNDLGYMYSGGWKAMVEDTRMVNRYVHELYPDLPLTLLGHSMGSMVVRAFAKRYDKDIDALCVVGCPANNHAKMIGYAMSWFNAHLRGDHYRSKLMYALTNGAFNKKFKNEPWKNGWICSDQEVMAKIESDPLCGFIFTANGFMNLMMLVRDCYSSRGWALAKPDMPVVFLSGAEDPCRKSDRELVNATKSIRKAGYRNVSLKTYPGMRHHIILETEHMKVWNDIKNLLQFGNIS